MATFLFCLPALGGHIQPTLPVLRALSGRGHRVLVYGDRGIRPDVLGAGALHCPPVAWLDPVAEAERALATGSRWRAPSPRASWAFVRGGIVGDARALVADVRAVVLREKPDVLVGDTMLPAAGMVAELTSLPWASIATTPALGFAVQPRFGHGFAPPGIVGALAGPVIARGMRRGLEANRFRHMVGLPPRAGNTFAQGISPLLHLWPATPRFLGPSRLRALPGNHHAVGPLVGDLQRPVPPEVTRLLRSSARPLIVIGSSTSGHLHRTTEGSAYLRCAIAAVAELEVRALVTLGNAEAPGASWAHGENTVITGFVPHGAVLPEASLCVSHGGWGTVGRCLAAGVPSIVVPLVNDEPFIAARLAEMQMGEQIPVEQLNPGALQEAIRAALANEDMILRVRLESEAIRRMAPADTVAGLLEELAHTGQPVMRREGKPGGGDGD